MLRRLRSQKRAVRLILALVTAGLVVSLVGTFAITSAPPVTGQSQDEYSPVPTGGAEETVRRLLDYINRQEAAAQAQPQDAELWLQLANARYELGLTYFSLQDLQRGIDCMARAVNNYQSYLNLKPQDVDARVGLATAAFYSNQTDMARENFKKALQQAPDNPVAHLNYGIFLLETDKDRQAAVAHWQQVEKIDSQSPLAQRARELITATNPEP